MAKISTLACDQCYAKGRIAPALAVLKLAPKVSASKETKQALSAGFCAVHLKENFGVEFKVAVEGEKAKGKK